MVRSTLRGQAKSTFSCIPTSGSNFDLLFGLQIGFMHRGELVLTFPESNTEIFKQS